MTSVSTLLKALVICLQSIENELLKRLEKGVYGDIHNPVKEYNKLPDDIEVKDVAIEHEEDNVCIPLAPIIIYVTPFCDVYFQLFGTCSQPKTNVYY